MSTSKKLSVKKTRRQKIHEMVLLAVLVALVIVLQIVGSMLPTLGSTSLSFVLIPIVIGGMLLGLKGGAVLGVSFGLVTVFMGLIGKEPLTAFMLGENPFLTTLVCLVKGVAAGICSALVYRALCSRHPRTAILFASATAPIVNTAIFMIGSTFMLDTLASLVGDVVKFLFFTILVCNFLVELAINVVAVPAIRRILYAAKKR